MKYMGRGEEGGGAPGCCDPLPSSSSSRSFASLHSSQSTGSPSREINRSERREEKTFLPPLPLAICPSSSSPFFHGEELSRCRLRRSRGWDGMELRQIGQSKVSLGGQSMGTHMILTGCNNAVGTQRSLRLCIQPGCTVLLHGHRLRYSQPYCHSGEGRGMGAVSKMHGMRWKVNSDTETEERGGTKGDGLLGAECVIKKMKDHIQVPALHCLRCSFVLRLTSQMHDRGIGRLAGTTAY